MKVTVSHKAKKSEGYDVDEHMVSFTFDVAPSVDAVTHIATAQKVACLLATAGAGKAVDSAGEILDTLGVLQGKLRAGERFAELMEHIADSEKVKLDG